MHSSMNYRIPRWTNYNVYRTRQLALWLGQLDINILRPVLKKLHWLPVKYRAQYKLLVHTYKALHDQSPVYLRDMLQIYTPDRTLISQNTQLLVVPKMWTISYGNRCFNYGDLVSGMYCLLTSLKLRQCGHFFLNFKNSLFSSPLFSLNESSHFQ